MAQFNQTMLAILVNEGLRHGNPIIKMGKCTIVKKVIICGSQFNVISFPEGKYVQEATSNSKRCYVELGEYLLSVDHKQETLKLSTALLYKVATGTSSQASFSDIDRVFSGSFMQIDGKILAVCDERIPRFFAVVNQILREISVTTALNILLQRPYNDKQLESLQRYFPEAGWKLHNGVLINPDTLDTPSVLHLRSWHNKRKTIKAKMRSAFDIRTLTSALSRSEKNRAGIIYLKSEQF